MLHQAEMTCVAQSELRGGVHVHGRLRRLRAGDHDAHESARVIVNTLEDDHPVVGRVPVHEAPCCQPSIVIDRYKKCGQEQDAGRSLEADAAARRQQGGERQHSGHEQKNVRAAQPGDQHEAGQKRADDAADGGDGIQVAGRTPAGLRVG